MASSTAILAADFHKDMTIVPGRADLARKINEEAVKESIRNLVLTQRGERPFQPDLGCDVRSMLFENITPQTLIMIETSIKDVIETYEPRCNLIAVDATAAADSNAVSVSIVFVLINNDTPVTFNLILDRVR